MASWVSIKESYKRGERQKRKNVHSNTSFGGHIYQAFRLLKLILKNFGENTNYVVILDVVDYFSKTLNRNIYLNHSLPLRGRGGEFSVFPRIHSS